MGSAQELALLIENNQEKFYRVAYAYVKNREDALDIVHDAIIKALRSYGTLRNAEYAQTWFYRILINESISFLRKSRRVIPWGDLSDPHVSPSAESPSDTLTDEHIDLYAAIDKLSPELKTIVVLHFFEDMTLSEVAEITSTNLSTVKSRLYRALKNLKLDMEAWEND